MKELLPRLFDEQAYPLITECMLSEARNDSSSDAGVVRFMSSFERVPCGHKGKQTSAEECLQELLKEPRYCLATSSQWAIKLSYRAPHVPVVMWDPVNRLMLREPTNSATRSVERVRESRRGTVNSLEKQLTRDAINQMKAERAEANKAKTARVKYLMSLHHTQKAKGPNPLSVKKKQQNFHPKLRLIELRGALKDSVEGETEDPILISRSKLRRKRQRCEMAQQRAYLRSSSGEGATNSTTSETTPEEPNLESSDGASLEPPLKKIRRRRKATVPANVMDGIQATSDSAVSEIAEGESSQSSM